MTNFPDKYKHIDVEKKWQEYWSQKKVYAWDKTKSRDENFVVDTPPPSVSGILHMGHICSYTQTDFIARYQRMKGMNVFYPIGFDDNGLPTERLVEKEKKVRAHQLPRKEFEALCHEVVDKAELEFEKLFNTVALSVDWSQKYQTISDSTTKISQMSFLDLFGKGAVYRAFEPTIWDPVDGTALAQADLEDKEVPGVMSDVNFTLEDGSELTIATTRPEMIPACVAILYHPEDDRYKHLAGSSASSPVFGVSVPIVPDDTVEIEKGTGVVMCCTFGDITDIEWWKKHKLNTRVIINKYGKLELKNKLGDSNFPFHQTQFMQEAVERLEGKKISAAREEMIEILKESGALIAQKEVTKSVKCAERSKAVVEIVITPQWFIKVLDKKEELLEKANQSSWYPGFMKARLESWIEGLNWDWCISRQRYFGVPFPVWYSKRKGEEGKILLPEKKDLPVNPATDLPKGYSRDEVEAENDVMDTWATSSVTPQINSHAINSDFHVDLDRHEKLYPADIRPQAHEIIRTWAFYTIVKSMYHEESIPWKNLVISGWVLAADKTKMSKSKGNIVTPIGLLEEKSSDVVRHWAASSKLGQDIVYSEDAFKIGKKLVNKLWNASKFVSIHFEDIDIKKLDLRDVKNVTDKWILSKLHKVIEKSSSEFEKFEYSVAKSTVEEFFWKHFCDNYLELVKIRIYDQEKRDPEGRKSAITTMALILDILLKLFAPFLPYITEELHEILFNTEVSIHTKGSWPEKDQVLYDKDSEKLGDNVVQILDLIRKFKAEKEMSIKAELSHVTILSKKDSINFMDSSLDLQNVMNISRLEIVSGAGDADSMLVTENGVFEIEIKQ